MNKDILLMVEALSNAKSINPEIIFTAIERALESVTEKQSDQFIRTEISINRKTGEYETKRVWLVVADDASKIELDSNRKQEQHNFRNESDEELEYENFDENYHIRYQDACKIDPDIQIGQYIKKTIQSIDFSRISAQIARKQIARKVREAEKQMVAEMYSGKVGEVITGVVKNMDRGNIIVDLIQTEGIIPQDNLIAKDTFRPGDRIRAIVNEINDKNRNQLVILDRKSPKLVQELFKIEVPEINEERIEIMAIARDPGFKTKIAVRSNDPRVTAYGACIGLRGSRIKAIQNELAQERIDVIQYDDDINQFVANALEPAEVETVVYDEDSNSVDVSVTEDNLALAIGKSGQNVRLASRLTDIEINIMTTEQFKQKQEQEFESYQNMLSESLGVDKDISSLLVQNGFINLQSIIQADAQDLLKIKEFDAQLVEQLQDIAREIALTRELSGDKLDDKLANLEGVDDLLAFSLLKAEIKTLDDLADLATDELVEMTGIDERRASRLIMRARKHWFDQENPAEV